MAIRYDGGLSSSMRKIVKNFNEKRRRALRAGYTNLPEARYVSDLKKQFTDRKALLKELQSLQSFNVGRQDSLKIVNLLEGGRAVQWELDYLKENTNAALDYFHDLYRKTAARVGEFPGERTRLDALTKKINTLESDLLYMNQSQFNSYKAAIREFKNKNVVRTRGYRNFLSEVEFVMKNAQYSKEDIDRFFEKVSQLDPDEFYEWYENSDNVRKIFLIVDSPIKNRGMKLNTTDTDAKNAVDSLVGEVDDAIKKYKDKSDLTASTPDVPKVRLPQSQLTAEQIQVFKSLGWSDLIDESA